MTNEIARKIILEYVFGDYAIESIYPFLDNNISNEEKHLYADSLLTKALQKASIALQEKKDDDWIPIASGIYPPEREIVQVTYLGYTDNIPYCDEFAYRSKKLWYWTNSDEKVNVDIIAWKKKCEPYNCEKTKIDKTSYKAEILQELMYRVKDYNRNLDENILDDICKEIICDENV